ncbi:glycosyltransferase family 1 protein [Sporolactobacillus sp. THM7-7]|nr:glycosyltransferase family 1 protein [Sporolactobacillus sp. THM7-7]
MKIAFICSDRGPCPPVKGGAIQLLIAKIAPLLAQIHEVTVFSITDPQLAHKERVDQVSFERYDKPQFFHRVCERVREASFDVIQVHNRPAWIPDLRLAAPKAKLFLSLHNLIFDTLKVDKDQAARFMDSADQILTVSRFVAKDTVRKFPSTSRKIHVLYTGVDVKDYAPAWTKKGIAWRRYIRSLYQISNHDPVLLFVGRLVSEKGCHLLLAAMRELLKSHSRVKLLVVGSKWYADESTSAYIDKLKHESDQMGGRVIFTSYVPVDDIPKYFAAADLFICPSQWKEPLARVHYEAMAAGLPIITTNRGGNAELFQSNDDAIVIKDYNQPEAFTQAIAKLLDDPKLAEKMGRLGRVKVEQTYNFERVASDLAALYQETTAAM